MVREEALVLVLVLVLAELAQGVVLAALVPVVQEPVALEWEPVSCRGHTTSDLRFASCCLRASASEKSPDTASKKEGLEVQ
jgi:hypothetical protein